ncbi:DUF4880 domain-containing protein [Achromobacter sp. Marseille-Q0513]|uniref:DUF4880 domain-containing protein n=1 Tax=Achromobacter sp. Marseille-Q0513 TaxID=2829161 RepID=UPI001B93BEE5|nr:DUF4880 domain-containing protein [Achromobacter sp. Marseille-Q0513]MBR8652518.1 DUF4880 domain-containing protein [Achromobacter sp. Marseille-Q0513]
MAERLDATARQAIGWWARLASGVASPDEHAACAAWLAQDPAHRAAWDRLQAIGRDARRVPSGLAHAALDAPASPARRAVLRNALSVAGVGVALWAGYRHAPWQRLLADHSTGLGERRTLAAAPGLSLTLNGDSALRLDVQARSVELLRGELLVRLEPQDGAPPLRVDTGHGILSATRAVFDLRRGERNARVGVYEGSVQIAREGGAIHISAGERAAFAERGQVRRRASDPDRLAWADGLVVAKDWRLDEFAAYLAAQRVGVIRVAPEVADLRLSGVFPLDDAERALRTLEDTLPIIVIRRTAYWLQVAPRET